MKIIILVPIYNDWQSVSKLLEEINSNIAGLGSQFSIIVINDASTDQQSINALNTENLQSIKIINMKENRGHARCIATGLKHIFEKEEFDYVIPMDGDGEDRPEEIKNFVEYLSYSSDKPIVCERIKRSESLFFKFCYNAHKILTFAFTGQSIKFGNYKAESSSKGSLSFCLLDEKDYTIENKDLYRKASKCVSVIFHPDKCKVFFK